MHETDTIFSIASTITKGAIRRHSKIREPSIQPERSVVQTDNGIDDLESIASFGDGIHDLSGGFSESYEAEDLRVAFEVRRSEAIAPAGHAMSSSSGNKAYSDAGDDSACMIAEDGGYPGFDVRKDDECK